MKENSIGDSEYKLMEIIWDYAPVASGHSFRHTAAAENVEMKMRYRLAGIRSAVGDDAVAAVKSGIGGNFPHSLKAGSNFIIAQKINFSDRGYMLFRNNKHVERGLRIDIPESKNILVFEYFIRRDFAMNDFTEKAVFHY